MRWLILKEDNTTIHNVIVADKNFIAEHYPSAIKIEDDVMVSPNDLYKDGVVSRVLPQFIPSEEIIDAEVVQSAIE
jgi:hypothetical protein